MKIYKESTTTTLESNSKKRIRQKCRSSKKALQTGWQSEDWQNATSSPPPNDPVYSGRHRSHAAGEREIEGTPMNSPLDRQPEAHQIWKWTPRSLSNLHELQKTIYCTKDRQKNTTVLQSAARRPTPEKKSTPNPTRSKTIGKADQIRQNSSKSDQNVSKARTAQKLSATEQISTK